MQISSEEDFTTLMAFALAVAAVLVDIAHALTIVARLVSP
jgi:hypothetical protein